ncbi:PREDICTED: general transcription factor IIH subunit 4-like [Priapulus caudatus]|uniref:General transcription factor IIH subunit 4 n=1 Tax=Priapulus caudatus TaxID=37621 RepID=A0ABM1F3Y6_PRICU|nr:PREDICTED: general transcription factor IIH subunit 4-like [Priapulus caudatus]
MRTLFVEQPVPQAVVSSWVNGKFHGEHNSAVKTLAGLRIWNEVHMPGGLRAWLLKNTFRVQLRIALLGGGKAWQGAVTGGTPDKYSKDVTFLDNYAKERWECVLHFMVGSTSGAADTVSSDTKQVLVKSGLMRRK